MSVAATNRQRVRKINLPLLKKIVSVLLAELEIGPADIGICLVDALEMTRLNESFLRHAGSTDVITFDYRPAGEAGCALPASGAHRASRPAIQGEIFVCMDEAVLQARKFGTSWPSEIVRYIVHGTLHLTGHEDRRPAARRKMKREENRLLGRLARRFSLAQLSRPARISA
jgi:probable rRNA maturation factor